MSINRRTDNKIKYIHRTLNNEIGQRKAAPDTDGFYKHHKRKKRDLKVHGTG